jgi:hypothetical protein
MIASNRNGPAHQYSEKGKRNKGKETDQMKLN